MEELNLRKITPVNGFDKNDRNNAKQNNYAWSMAEFGNHIYIGTARNTFYIGLKSYGFIPPKEYTPEDPIDMGTEIWRCCKYCKYKKWERVFKASEEEQILGIRCFIEYKGTLYGGCHTLLDKPYLTVTDDGKNWSLIPAGIPDKFGTRSMAIHKGRLYIGATDASNVGGQETFLYSSDNPKEYFNKVNVASIKGEITSMISFNGYLYIGTSPSGGFEIWKSKDPESGIWELVVDKGAGDALNEIPISMEIYNDHIYVGSAIWMAIRSTNSDQKFVPLKGFDVIRISKHDKWELIVGSEPLIPTTPTTGQRNKGAYPSGFGNIFNSYCWQIKTLENRLYISSWDSSKAFYTIVNNFLQSSNPETDKDDEVLKDFINAYLKYLLSNKENNFNFSGWIKAFIKSISKLPENFGFDFHGSKNGFSFETISLDGFDNSNNYGIRTLLPVDDKLYIGTANPVEGCEIWTLQEEKCC